MLETTLLWDEAVYTYSPEKAPPHLQKATGAAREGQFQAPEIKAFISQKDIL